MIPHPAPAGRYADVHTFLAEALGYGSSPTLWAVAHDQRNVALIWEQEEEEAWMLAFQNYLNDDRPPNLCRNSSITA